MLGDKLVCHSACHRVKPLTMYLKPENTNSTEFFGMNLAPVVVGRNSKSAMAKMFEERVFVNERLTYHL